MKGLQRKAAAQLGQGIHAREEQIPQFQNLILEYRAEIKKITQPSTTSSKAPKLGTLVERYYIDVE